MKKAVIILICCIAFTSVVFGQAGIKVIAKLKIEEGNYDKSNISILKNNKLFRSYHGNQKIDLLLLHDCDYEFIFTKKGYVEKRVVFSTKNIPLPRWKKGFFTFPFEVLLKMIDDENPAEKYQYPVAITNYDEVFDDFSTITDYSFIAEEINKNVIAENNTSKGLIRDIVLRPISVVDNKGFLKKYNEENGEEPVSTTELNSESYENMFHQLAEALQQVKNAKEANEDIAYNQAVEKLYTIVDETKVNLSQKQKEQVASKLNENVNLIGSKEDKYVVMSVFTAALYGSSNQKEYGYINYGDGKGYQELDEEEFDQYRCLYYGCRAEKQF